MRCYCGSNENFSSCCQPLLRGKRIAETAEQLMRSRYCAYIEADGTYLRSTWVNDQCPQDLALENKINWVGLEVVACDRGQQNDDTGQVEFKAWFIENEKLFCLHEVSEFEKQKGQWLYHSGKMIEEPAEAISRNQACPCGSGKKFKRCCLSSK